MTTPTPLPGNVRSAAEPVDDVPGVPAPDPDAVRAWHAAADRLTDWTIQRLVVRPDRYGGYFREGGTLRKQTKPACGARRNAFSRAVIRAHFLATSGEAVVGGHPLTAATDATPSRGKWVAIDLDNHGDLPAVAARNLRYVAHLYRRLCGLGFRPLACTWGTGGFHLWVFLDGLVGGPALHAFGAWLVADADRFGYYVHVPGDAASGWPESNPKQPRVTNYGNFLRFPGRHHSRDVWPIVYNGAAWVQGEAAVELVLSLDAQPADLIPAAAALGAAPVKTARGKKPKRHTGEAKPPAAGDRDDVFATYNRTVTFDDVVAWHSQFGRHPILSRAPDRVEFGRFGADDEAPRFNIALRDGVAVTYNFSPNAGLPHDQGLSPSQVRCFYETGRCDAAAMRAFAAVLRRELGWVSHAPPVSPPAGRPAVGDDPGVPSPVTDGGYCILFGGTYHCRMTRNKETGELVVADQTRLANFAARIVGETVTDDGAERTRGFAVVVEHPRRPPATVVVPVEQFAMLDWVVEQFGPGYVISAGRGVKDHLRAAIQELSGDAVPTTTIYAHTGWREAGGQWAYLHAGGAVGLDAGAVSVRLDGAAAGFALPPPPVGDELRAAVRASLGVLDGLAPDAVAFPLLATVYRAPLGPADYALWLSGLTGTNKSELAALAQQHFGAGMTRTRLPGNWASTDNALEGLAFVVRDAVLVVDDFAPPASRADADRLHRTAERLIRGAGNAAGRQRMRADGTLRPPKPPRALVISTGEDLPRGLSVAARLWVVEVGRGTVNLSRLSACQRDAAAGVYAAAMAGYVAWLATDYAAVKAGFDADRLRLRDGFVNRFPHARTPDIVANLLVGLASLLRFAEAVGAIDAAEHETLWRRGQAAFLAVAGQQVAHQQEADPVEQFPATLATVVSSGRGHFAGEDGREPTAPPGPTAWGWEERAGQDTFDARPTYHPRGRKVGWVGDGMLYLEPNAVYAAVADFAREKGQTYPLTQPTLFRRLKEAGLVARTDGDRTTYPVTLEGVRRRVVHLRAEVAFPTEPEASRFPGGGVPTGWDEAGRGTGGYTLGESGFVPAVPVVPVSDGVVDAGTSRDELVYYDAIAH